MQITYGICGQLLFAHIFTPSSLSVFIFSIIIMIMFLRSGNIVSEYFYGRFMISAKNIVIILLLHHRK
jgi:hypothetical protein